MTGLLYALILQYSFLFLNAVSSSFVKESLSSPVDLVVLFVTVPHTTRLGEQACDINRSCRGTWVAQSVKCPTSAQVMISQLVGSSPTSGSVLTAQSLEPVSDSVSPSLSDPPLFMLCLSLSQK